MAKQTTAITIPDETVMNKIYIIRGQKVMIDRDIAELYDVETKALKQAVKRNMDVFPQHFMFEMTDDEFKDWRSQFVTSNSDKMGLRYKPFCFTEHGVLQSATVLKSNRAKKMSIRIIEVFVKMREMLLDNTELRLAIEKLERSTENNKKNIELVFQYIDELTEKKDNPELRNKIGYKLPKKK
ncbi:MAG: ORF6N domain-containing protein [Bacteroidota bacterium]